MSDDPRNNVFLDTNILVYAYDMSAGEKHAVAAQLVERLWEEETGCLSLQVLQEFYVTVTQKIPNLLPPLKARQVIDDLSHWRLHCPDGIDLLKAIDLQQSLQLSFWDANVIQTALALGSTIMFSEDLSHGQLVGNLHIVNPFKANN